MDRRTFMKLLGGLASMPIVGRIAKPFKSETVQEGIATLGNKGMELYEMVIAKVMKEGKKIKESNRVESYKHPDRPDITVDVDQTTGSAEIYFDTDEGTKGFAEIRRDPEAPGSDELIEAEEVYKFFNKGEDYVRDRDWETYINDVDDLSVAEYYVRKAKEAKRRGIDFTLSLMEFKTLVKRKRCYYSGVFLTRDGSRNTFTIDRIDNKLGYTKANSVPCAKFVNNMKNILIEDELSEVKVDVKMLKRIVGKL